MLQQEHGDKVGEDGEGGKALSKGRNTDTCTHTACSEEIGEGTTARRDVPMGGCEEPHSEGLPPQGRVPQDLH